MKSLFIIIMVVAVVSVLYQFGAGLKVMAHNHYQYRQQLLDLSARSSGGLNPIMGLTLDDLAKCDEHVANAYKISVHDGYRLGVGYSTLQDTFLVQAGLLFVTGFWGLRASKKPLQSGDPTSNHSVEPRRSP